MNAIIQGRALKPMSGRDDKHMRDAGTSRKGRPPIRKKAMSAAERQRRRRKKLAKSKLLIAKELLTPKEQAWAKKKKYAETYLPAPPGITYWRYRQVRLPNGALSHIPWPETKPLAACRQDLDAGDLLALIRRLSTIARDRGFVDEARREFDAGMASVKDAPDQSNYASGLVVFRDETGSRKGGWTGWGYEAGIGGRGPKPLHESPRITVTEDIEELIDLALARVLSPEFEITEDIKHRFGVIINEMTDRMRTLPRSTFNGSRTAALQSRSRR